MDATLTRQNCPVCEASLSSEGAPCSRCGADLRLLNQESDPAIAFYNRALDAAQEGRLEEALEQIRGAMAAAPRDVEIRIVAGKLLAQAADYAAAVACWQQAQQMSPDAMQAATLQACLDSARQILRRQAEQERRAHRSKQWLGAAAAGGLAVLAGAAGFLLHRPPAPPDPLTAAKRAINNPNIKINRTGDRLVLQGIVNSDSERQVMVALAAYAAHQKVDAAGLKIREQEAAMLEASWGQGLLEYQSLEPSSESNAKESPQDNSQTSRSGQNTYIFKKEDTLAGIARKCGRKDEDARTLMRENGIANAENIAAGTVLKLPAGWKIKENSTPK